MRIDIVRNNAQGLMRDRDIRLNMVRFIDIKVELFQR